MRFCPTRDFSAPSVEIGLRLLGPHRGSNSEARLAYLGSSSNFRFTTASMYWRNAGGVYLQSASALVAIFFLHTKNPLLSPW